MEWSKSIRAGRSGVALSGDLDESFEPEALLKFMKSVASDGLPGAPIRLWLAGLDSGNSMGLKLFVQMVRNCPYPLIYSEIPGWIVMQLNYLVELVPPCVVGIESLIVECTLEGSPKTQEFVLKLGIDIPLRNSYSGATFRVLRDGATWLADLSPDDLGFLERNYPRFQAAAAKLK